MHKKMSFTMRYVFAIGVMLLAADILLSGMDYFRNISTIRALVNKSMMNVTSTAAGLIDGDTLGALTEDDVGSEAYNDILRDLSSFQKNADIEFIYAVRQVSEDRFVFIVDADPDDPAAFGEDIVVSSGLRKAGQGILAVDDAPLADRWGNYYSAYCPVFDSGGNVAGVIGVDFDAQQYNAEVRKNTRYISLMPLLTALVGIIVLVLITHRVRKKFMELNVGIAGLGESVDGLIQEVDAMSGHAMEDTCEGGTGGDELDELGGRIHCMQRKMKRYMEYLKLQAYVDALTQVGSTSAYHERLKKLGEAIQRGSAAFAVAIFDINSLKQINDTYGHEQGDIIIKAAANAIASVFGAADTYRIGGDEFAVIAPDITPAHMASVKSAVVAYNETQPRVKLSMSRGTSAFRPGEDSDYQTVFARADKIMYESKKAYYKTVGDRRSGR